MEIPQQRIGYAERDAAVAELQAHHAEGRLSVEEFEERMQQALQAKTHADLQPLFADLPQQGSPLLPAGPGASTGATGSAVAAQPSADADDRSGLSLPAGEPMWLSALRIASWAAVPMGFVALFILGNFELMLLLFFAAPALAVVTGAISKKRDDEARQRALEQRKDWL